MRYESGAFLSVSRTLPSNVPFTAATPTFIVALYSSSPTASRRSHPGIAFLSCSGSRNASHTRCRGAEISCAPSIFIPANPPSLGIVSLEHFTQSRRENAAHAGLGLSLGGTYVADSAPGRNPREVRP